MNAPADLLPRRRFAGPLTLDLLERDAFVGRSRVGLHPREFELLWRLADSPGVPVARGELLRDVWKLAHVPETNTLEVHVCRLRAKLAPFGCAWIVATAPNGGYLLDAASGSHCGAPGEEALDSRTSMRDGRAVS